ncbi:mechanosensitive ion channel family protein [Thalassolituus sp.]|jgi:small conductance mechanosensitive channel|uniref:mechanosensitive ion channel family protein n=1 Tax=Thalassolituus sp. TaxID=2030822 RepID=UPI002A7EA81E|nr:mechanosensitive ion channel domain-containing protein [Thalassolituus sp.]|tara:strand:- start:20849 stop:21685 length:837 start_codon:yes stop_codon:yes gene_type:complete
MNLESLNLNPEILWADYVLPWGTQIVLALLIFIIGRIAVGMISNGVSKVMTTAKLDPILVNFLSGILRSVLLLLVLVFALSKLGLDTTSLVALLGAAGLAVGLALKDSLSHFAAGVMLILFRPFKVGDYVEINGVGGSVEQITILSTRLKSPDNKVITVPNASVFGNTMINFSEQATRRVDMVVGIGYGSDLLKAKAILEEMVNGHELVLKDPAPKIAVSELADSSVNFVVRPWVNAADYWTVKWDLTEKIKLRFDAEGIEIPFPQMSVHIEKTENAA